MLCTVAVDVVTPEDPVVGVRAKVESVAQDQGRDAADRVAALRGYRQDLVLALGALDSYVGSLEKLREAEAATHSDVMEAVRHNADAREEMLRIGAVEAADLDEAGYLSHGELDALAEEGLLEEAAPLLVERVRAARAQVAALQEVAVEFDSHLHPRDRKGKFMETLGKLPPGGVARMPDGTTIRRTSSGARRFKVRRPGESKTQTVTGLGPAASVMARSSISREQLDDALASIFTRSPQPGRELPPAFLDHPSQPFHDEEALYRAATRDTSNFRRVLNMGLGVSRTLDAKVHVLGREGAGAKAVEDVKANPDRFFVMIGGLKGRARAEQKVAAKYDGDWSRLTDVLRATVTAPTLAEVPAAVDAIREQAAQNGWTVRSPENRFVTRDDGVNTGPMAGGYADVSMLLQAPDGLVTEVQVNVNPMFVAKQTKGHALYEEARVIQGKASLGRPLSAEERQRLEELDRQSAEVYAEAMRESYP